jgi:hypothetical protein
MSERMTVGQLVSELLRYPKEMPVLVFGAVRTKCGYDEDYMPNLEVFRTKVESTDAVVLKGQEDW